MPKPFLPRPLLAEKRLLAVLRSHVIATARTLEQKISDAGPGGMRIDPHELTKSRKRLETAGTIARVVEGNTPWFHLATATAPEIAARLAVQRPILAAVQNNAFVLRLGQALEIAVFRALTAAPSLRTLGSYTDLDKHDDATLYSKEEPPSSISGRSCAPKKLDFLVVSVEGTFAGIEVKNVREWMYPDRIEIRDLFYKATALDVVPVFIARRIPYVTFKLFNTCGVIVHQTYNQLFPTADATLAGTAKHKSILGYHDIRIGNQPDARLLKFVQVNLPSLIAKMRPAFDEYKDLLHAFGNGVLDYAEFAARVRRRSAGTNEDSDCPDEDE